MRALPDTDTLVSLAHRLADAAGGVTRRYFRAPCDAEIKSDNTPVTRADREAEMAIRAILEKERPSDAVHGEECGTGDFGAEFIWIIDPIDGTGSFMTGRPIFGTLVALFHNGAPVLGIIDQPITKERWLGVAGRSTTLNGAPIRCAPCPGGLARANIGTWGPTAFLTPQALDRFNTVSKKAGFTIFGGDCYLYAQVAMGFLDAAIDENMKLHDYAALIPVIEGAGGKITDWEGRPLGLAAQSPVVAAGDAALHAELCGLLAG